MAVWPTRNGAVVGMKVSTFEKGKTSFVYIVLVVKSFSGKGEITLIFLGLDFFII